MWPVPHGKPTLPLREQERATATARAEGAALRLVAPPLPVPSAPPSPTPSLSEVVMKLSTLGKSELPRPAGALARCARRDRALGAAQARDRRLRIGVSARLAKTAVAALGDKDPQEIELIWPGSRRPTSSSSPGSKAAPTGRRCATSHRSGRPMLAHALEEAISPASIPRDFMAEWKWDGIRVQAVAGTRRRRRPRRAALFAHRRGHLRQLSGPDRGAAARRRRSTANS